MAEVSVPVGSQKVIYHTHELILPVGQQLPWWKMRDPTSTKAHIQNIDYWAWSLTYWDPTGAGISTNHVWLS